MADVRDAFVNVAGEANDLDPLIATAVALLLVHGLQQRERKHAVALPPFKGSLAGSRDQVLTCRMPQLVHGCAPRAVAGTTPDQARGGAAFAGVDNQHLLLRGNARNPRLQGIQADAVLLGPLPARKIERLRIVKIAARHGLAMAAQVEHEYVPKLGARGDLVECRFNALLCNLFFQQGSDIDLTPTNQS